MYLGLDAVEQLDMVPQVNTVFATAALSDVLEGYVGGSPSTWCQL
jgi:hypothetical protein